MKETRFSSIGELTDVLSKQLFEVHAFGSACGGIGQLQPINVVDTAPMKSNFLIRSFASISRKAMIEMAIVRH